MNDEMERTENEQSAPPAMPAANQPGSGESRPPRGAWLKKALPVVLVAVAFGAAGFLIGPAAASSDSLEQAQQNLRDLHQQVAEAVAARAGLRSELVKLKAELTSASQRVQDAEAAQAASKANLAVAEQSVAQLSVKLKQAEQASAPIQTKLAASQKAATSAKSRAEALTVELTSARDQAKQLQQAGNTLQASNAKLSTDLKSQRAVSGRLERLLGLLDLGDASSEPLGQSAWPAEMPVTEKELMWCMGQPSVSFNKGRDVEMKWGGKHAATVADGMVTTIDGKSATRSMLASVAPKVPATVAAPGPWSVGQGQALDYADLASMFGRPERVAGTGKNFTASWRVGAWGRWASATVADGVVTSFDSKAVSPAACCELVRHRAEAYRNADQAVGAQVALAREAYKLAAGAVADELAKEARSLKRDGVALKEWKLAPFDSVGTWVGRTNVGGGATVVRAAMECTWTSMGGEDTTQRRFVVVTMAERAGRLRSQHCAIFAGRD